MKPPSWKWALVGWAGSLLYAAAGVLLLRRWLRSAPATSRMNEPALRFFKPATQWDRALLERLVRWQRLAAPADQVEVITDELTEPIRSEAVERLGRGLVMTAPSDDRARNPKMTRLAWRTRETPDGPAWWVVSDQDVRPTPALLDMVRHLARLGEGVWSFPYRFESAGWASDCDRASFHLSQWPGIAWLIRTGRTDFCLGAVMLIPSAVMRKIGGFEAYTRQLAEDYRIGEAASRLGISVRIAPHPVTLEAEPMSVAQWWRHQRRMSVTFRMNNPAGYAGSVLVMSGAWWWLAWLAGAPVTVLAGMLLARAGLARWSAAVMDEPKPWRLTLASLPAILLEPVFYGLAWLRGRRVWWRGEWLRIAPGGEISPETPDRGRSNRYLV